MPTLILLSQMVGTGEAPAPPLVLAPSMRPVHGTRWEPVHGTRWEPVHGTRWEPVHGTTR